MLLVAGFVVSARRAALIGDHCAAPLLPWRPRSSIMSSFSHEFPAEELRLLKQTAHEMGAADELLYQMLPRAIVMQLKEGSVGVAERYDNVGILFSDVKGFTNICAAVNPDDVVKMVSVLFKSFDELTDKHRLFKVQTIGDAYVVASGLPYVDLTYSVYEDQDDSASWERYRKKTVVHSRASELEEDDAEGDVSQRLVYMRAILQWGLR